MGRNIPSACKRGNHDFGQAGRCSQCGLDRADTRADTRRTGGAGSLTHPLSDRDYKREMDKLMAKSGK